MRIKGEAKLLRIFIGESDKVDHKPVYEVLVKLAKEHNLAGTTILKGITGFGKNSIIHTSKILVLSEDLPMVVEIVDEAAKIEKFTHVVSTLFEESKIGGLITIEKVEIIKYSSS